MKSKLVMIAMTILGIASPSQAQELKSGIDKANMDLSVKPGDDFMSIRRVVGLKTIRLMQFTP